MIFIKIHRGSSPVTAACDEELVGKKFRDGELVLNVSESFYKGKLMKEEKARELLKKAVNLNLVGKKSIDIALNLNLISKNNILFVQEVPYALSVVL